MPARPGPCLVLVAALALGCGEPGGAARTAARTVAAGPTPAAYQRGAALFDSQCAACHGPQGAGTTQGPPLVHPIYEPGHHADAAFVRAVELGVRAHHWGFGDMPPVPDVTRDQVAEIVRYVRWLQRVSGISLRADPGLPDGATSRRST